MAVYEYENPSGSSKWDQPCQVIIDIHDLDQAHALANSIKEFADKAAMGGDFSLSAVSNGDKLKEAFIGHDVTIERVTLRVGAAKTK